MRLAFMGTPAFSVPVLSELVAVGHEIAAVYTQPPRRSGRGKKLNPSPVQLQAEKYNLPVRNPLNFKQKEDKEAFAALSLDVAVVVAYGLILPKAILEAPRLGCLNLHASLLPRWRGAAPIHRAIMAGDKVTGVQVMQMEAGLDTGPVLLSESVPILDSDTTGTLHESLSQIGAQLMPRALAALSRDSLVGTPQSEEGVCYAHKITSEEAQINWSQPSDSVDFHIRGLSPAPGAWFLNRNNDQRERMKVLLSQNISELPQDMQSYPAGTILHMDGRLVVTCGRGGVALLKVQRPGKSVQSGESFVTSNLLKHESQLELA